MPVATPLNDLTPKPEMASEFLSFWYAGAETDWLSQIVRMRAEKAGTKAFTFTWTEIIEAIQSSGLDRLIWESELQYDLYTSVGFLYHAPVKGKRGGKNDISHVGGVWLDLDCKDGAFKSESAALDFARSLELRPSCLVRTGTGGVHAYWKLDTFYPADEANQLCLRWYEYSSAVAGSVEIDKLCNPDRIMRLPGSIRFPKELGEQVSICELEEISGAIYSASEIVHISETAWTARQEQIERVRREVTTRRIDTNRMLSDTNNRWLKLMALSEIEDEFNERYSWDSILLPYGWIKLGVDSEDRVLWSRPGDGSRKSATTDWPESPNVMSLFSTAPETGLLDLFEADILLDKYRVWIQLAWSGDESAFVENYLKDMQ